MPTIDILEALAAISYPMPDAESFAAGNPHLSDDQREDILGDLRMEVARERASAVEDWREAIARGAEEGREVDPLLDTLSRYRRQMLRVEHQMRLVIAYAREFVRPQPYQLKALAHAAGMSISGVRIAYDEDEVSEIGELIGAKPRRPLPSVES
jgi:hypothetical protein